MRGNQYGPVPRHRSTKSLARSASNAIRPLPRAIHAGHGFKRLTQGKSAGFQVTIYCHFYSNTDAKYDLITGSNGRPSPYPCMSPVHGTQVTAEKEVTPKPDGPLEIGDDDGNSVPEAQVLLSSAGFDYGASRAAEAVMYTADHFSPTLRHTAYPV